MRILNQPQDTKIGDELNKILNNNNQNHFETFYFIVAYAKNSGIKHILESIERFKKTGGKVKAIVGIDQQGTSLQALNKLLEIVDETYIFHNNKLVSTFHPKIYAFVKEKEKAIIIIGSSNLTEGGLYTNYETNSYTDLNLLQREDQRTFFKFKSIFQGYCTNPKISKKLTKELLENLFKQKYISDETKNKFFSKNNKKTKKKLALFGTENISVPSFKQKKRISKQIKKIDKKTKKIKNSGLLVWRKMNLPTSDAQQVKSGTAYTGNIKLTQAKWKINDIIIDQTNYFRNTIFNHLQWTEIKNNPYIELAKTKFRVLVKNTDLGIHELSIRHKPSGEAGQANYTTYISWGTLQQTIMMKNITGMNLLLYKPKNSQDPFIINITN